MVEEKGAEQVLLLCEDVSFAQTLKNFLESFGYRVESVWRTEEAKAILEKGLPFRCVLFEIGFGGEESFSLAHSIFEAKRIPLIVLFDGEGEKGEDLFRFLLLGCGHLPKQAPREVFLCAVRFAFEFERYHAFFTLHRRLWEDSLHEIYLFHPHTLRLVTVNQGAIRNLGYTLEELYRLTVLDIQPECTEQKIREILTPLFAGERKKIIFATVHRRKNGSLYPVEVHLELFEYHGGQLVVAWAVDRTAPRLLEDKMKEQEAFLWTITESVHDAIVVVDEKEEIVFWNRAAQELFGYPREEVLGKDFWSFLVPEEEIVFSHLLRELESLSSPSFHKCRVKHKDGKVVEVEIVPSLFQREGKRYLLGVVRDIGERRKEEKLLQSLVANVPNPTLVVSDHFRIVVQNKAAEDVFHSRVGGYCSEEIFSLPGISDGKTKCAFCRLEEALRRNMALKSEVKAQGRIFEVWWVPIGMELCLCYFLEVTHYRKMEEELRRQEERLKLFLSALPVGAVIVDAHLGRIEEVNGEALELFGTPRWQVVNQPWEKFFLLDEEARVSIKASRDEVKRFEGHLLRADGTALPVLKTVRGLKTEEGEKILITFLDLSERRRLEEELHRLAVTDPLTGAYNRRYFMEALEREIERVRRGGSPFSLVMFDFDHFKSINDRFGHFIGDEVLQGVIQLVLKRIRKNDILARFGGEEFIILLTQTHLLGAVGVAEELRRRIANYRLRDLCNCAASFGVTSFLPGDTADTLLRRVDQALYTAKREGRNRVVEL